MKGKAKKHTRRERKRKRWDKHVTEQEGIEYWKFDNGEEKEMPKKELRKQIVKEMHNKINHKGTEAHRSNGRFERVIRKGMLKWVVVSSSLD